MIQYNFFCSQSSEQRPSLIWGAVTYEEDSYRETRLVLLSWSQKVAHTKFIGSHRRPLKMGLFHRVISPPAGNRVTCPLDKKLTSRTLGRI
ncbi:hypothetical protein CEXT_781461 [Caerostris extrusa]|uniref:Uncharacterized protein n=1 Tax=Caerostris extrusa TaxID=172846 RepID=A0AAV4XQ81_CAEEX|nr:hypothetical protein CEXT_781461 [Caerostris extrusa]